MRDLLAMSFPYPHDNISVETRSPLAIAGLTELSSSSDVSRVLAEIEATRALENPGAIYYGFVADRVMRTIIGAGSGRLVGVAYVNSPEYSPHSWKLSALGTDSMLALAVPDSLGLPWTWWARIMIHELGHVHGRHHAPCGGAGGADPAFPYSNGALGSQGIYASFYNDATFGSVGAPASMTDVMGYCEGVWFSDYNYYAIQRFAERYSSASDASPVYAGLSVAREQSFLVLTGEISSSGVTLRPASLSARPLGDPNSAATDYDIILRTADNREFVQPFAPYVSSEITDRLSFRVSVPAGTRISQVQIRKSGIALFHQAAAAGSGHVTWRRDAAGLWVEWDSTLEPHLSVVRVTRQGKRTVLRLFAGGGRVHVPAEEFAGAGIELLLSTQLNARMLRAIEP